MSAKIFVILVVVVVICYGGLPSDSTPNIRPAKAITRFISNFISAIIKWAYSLKSSAETVGSGHLLPNFEHGYTIETVFDGSKHGIEPYSVVLSPNGRDLLVVDSANSNIFQISTPFSHYSRPKLVAGSPEGYYGYVDGLRREVLFNHPKSLALDGSGNIYVADTMNMAIRKISDRGVTTIAGGEKGRTGSNVGGPGEDARLSNDFDITYVRSSCSLLVVDRGYGAIREIQLKIDDCHDSDNTNFYLGIAMLVGAILFGYVIALFQSKFRTVHPSDFVVAEMRVRSDQRAYRSMRPPLIASPIETEKPEEGFFGSLARLLLDTISSLAEIVGGLIFGRHQKPLYPKQQPNLQPMYESYTTQVGEAPPLAKTKMDNPFSAKHFDRIQPMPHKHFIPAINNAYNHHLLQKRFILQSQHLKQHNISS